METFKVYIEIQRGSNLKYEYDEESESLKLNFTFENLYYPFNYGFIQNTLAGDGDELDAIVLASAPLKSGSVVECKVVGIFRTVDRGEEDGKIVCVPVSDALADKYEDVQNLPPDSLQQWTDFYTEVARQKKKVIEFKGLGSKQEALEEIKKSLS